MKKLILSLSVGLSVVCMVVLTYGISYAAGNGNPKPGYKKDTLIFHIQKEQGENFNHDCNGGHSVHIGAWMDADGVMHPEPTTIEITMKDYVAFDDDGDGVMDEDPLDGVDNDGDFLVDEDPVEPNFKTFATDCDSRAPGDNTVGFQIGDKDPDKGQISAQSWFLRLVGAPQRELLFQTSGKHAIDCTLVDNPDGIIGNEDDVIECNYEVIPLDHINVKTDCNMAFKEGGRNKKGGGKTSFCDITGTFLVDIDDDNDGVIDEDPVDGIDNDGDGLFDEDDINGEHIFSSTCYATFGISTDEDPLDGFDNDFDGLNGEDPFDQIDNDGDGLIDEDPLEDPFTDQDGDGLDGEDPINGIDDDGDETGEYCPLGSALWDIDSRSGNPVIQVFVIHDEMNVSIKQTKGVKNHN